MIAESKLDQLISDDDFSSIYYSLYRRDRTRHGGGLMVYIKKNLSVTQVQLNPILALKLLSFCLRPINPKKLPFLLATDRNFMVKDS